MVFIRDGIAYADEPASASKFPRITGVRPLPNYHLSVRLNDGSTKIVDMGSLLSEPCYKPLADQDTFNSVYLDYGAPTWNDGEIDLAPEYVLEHGTNL